MSYDHDDIYPAHTRGYNHCDHEWADEPWKAQANCAGVDPALFFPERGDSVKAAKAVCAGCEVRQECLDYALRLGIRFGIFGGKSERERRVLRRSLRVVAS